MPNDSWAAGTEIDRRTHGNTCPEWSTFPSRLYLITCGLEPPMPRPPQQWALDCEYSSEEQQMPLINIVLVLIIVGVGLYLINRFIPMAASINKILNIVVVVAVCVWLLQVTGLIGNVTNIRVGR
jgi:hypothetical protein